MPDPGEAGPQGQSEPTRPVGGLVLQPYGAPVGEPRYEELSGERGHEVLVELPGEEVGGLGEEGEGAPVEPVAVLSRPLPRSGSDRLAGRSRPDARPPVGTEPLTHTQPTLNAEPAFNTHPVFNT